MKSDFKIDDPTFKQNPFSVPESYFSDLRQEIMEEIDHPVSKNSLLTFIKPQLALVASFILVFGFAYGAFTLFSPSFQTTPKESLVIKDTSLQVKPTDENLDDSDIIEYLKEDLSGVYVANLE